MRSHDENAAIESLDGDSSRPFRHGSARTGRTSAAPARMLIVALALLIWPVMSTVAHEADVCRPLDAGLPEAQRKYHPGHYVSIGRAALRKGVSTAFGDGVRGIQLRYRWADLEPRENQYDFSAVARDLDRASKANLQFVAMIEDKTFEDESPLPAYLEDRIVRGMRGHTTIRWDPYVVERMGKLVQAFGRQFDCNPNLEGIAFQETAPSVERSLLERSGYTPEKYRDAIVRTLRHASDSLPRSRVFWYMNFLPGNQGYIGDIAQELVGTGVVMGGPDILPDNSALKRRVYPFYEEFHGQLKLFGSMQNDSYRHPRGGGAVKGKGAGFPYAQAGAGPAGYWSMEDLYVFARDRLHVNYIFWEYRMQPQPTDSHDWSDAREVIARHPRLS